MIKTTSVANAIIRYIASNIVIIPPPFKKGVANRSLDNLTLIIAYSARANRKILALIRVTAPPSQYEGGLFIFPAAQFAAPLLPAGPFARDAAARVWPPWPVRSLA
ncbi:MAG TPA: hypothetical protein PKC64_20650 [Sporomusa sphaeroides]|nr:hypothetical protein [Sporomusa sphaeroides]